MFGGWFFARIMLVGSVVFIFFRIYQHNIIIKLNYDYQRCEKKKNILKKERNELYATLLSINEPEKIMMWAEKQQGMKPLRAGQVVYLENMQAIDFIGTTSHGGVFHYLGICDELVTKTGVLYHVGA